MKQDRRRRIRRPLDWGKEKALVLAADKSKTFREHLREVAGPLGVGWGALYQEIQRWKNEDEEFHLAYHQAMGPLSKSGGAIVRFTRDSQTAFLNEYLKHGNQSKAAEKAGISSSHVYNVRRPGSKDYDPEFHSEFERVKRIRLQIVEDGLHGDMVNARMESDYKTSSNIAKFILERQDPENWGRMVEMRVSGKVEHEHEHKFKPQEALEIMQRDFKDALERQQPKEIEAEVVR